MMPDKKWQWQEGEYTVTRSVCWSGGLGCHGGCGLLLYSKGGKLVKIEGNPNYPHNQGRLCPKVFGLPELVNHPDRLKYPLKRVGERGENKWQRISWDEALSTITDKFQEIIATEGPEAIAIGQGTGRIMAGVLPRLGYSIGSPNGFNAGYICYFPRGSTLVITSGTFLEEDCAQWFEERYDSPLWKVPECILVWANNPLVSNPDGFFGHWLVDCMKKGSKLIVIDPRLTWLASRADLWLQIRPGTDGALALGMMNYIINQDLHDKEFVDQWTHGFEQLKERVQEYPVEKVAEITWIPEEKIIEAARLYAKSKPAALKWGLPLDMLSNATQTSRAVHLLMALTGNIDVPGGNIASSTAFNVEFATWGFELLPEGMWEKRIGAQYPMTSYFIQTSHPPSLWDAILTGEPYPIRALLLDGTNLLLNYSNPQKTYEALKKVDFTVAVDLFQTPTTMLADIVLPVAAWPELNHYRTYWVPLAAQVKAVEPVGECKSDMEIFLELGKRLAPQAWPWNSVEEMFDEMIKASGMTFEELCEKGWAYPSMDYKRYEKGMLRPDGQPGFNTPTGKVELYSTLMEDFGLDPLPNYREPEESPIGSPTIAKEYPLVLTTGARSWAFFHTEERQLELSREIHPDPEVEIHPETAEKLGIHDGDWVWIDTRRGKCRQKVKLTRGIDPRVVSANHGWWFPEKKAEEPSLFGVWESNINICTDDSVFDPGIGTNNYKSLLCKIYKVKEGE